MAFVQSDAIERAMQELQLLGITDNNLPNGWALGWVSLQTSGSQIVLAVGGGSTSVHEARACEEMDPCDPHIHEHVHNEIYPMVPLHPMDQFVDRARLSATSSCPAAAQSPPSPRAAPGGPPVSVPSTLYSKL